MPVWTWVLIGIGCAAVLLIVLLSARTRTLRNRFGTTEYDRTRDEMGSRLKTTSELRGRERRRKELTIVPLSGESRGRFAAQWVIVQGRFVDHPAEAVREADVLVTDAMREIGYPMDDFDQRAADISVDHPKVVEHYRDAHATKDRSDRGGVSTEDLREAFVHYRALFEELLGERVGSQAFDTAPRVVHVQDIDEEEPEGGTRRVS